MSETHSDTDSGTEAATATQSIAEKVERVNEIIDLLEDGDVSLEQAKSLREEGRDLLASLEDDMDLGDASIIEQG